MKKQFKQFLSLLLALSMVFGCISFGFADDPEITGEPLEYNYVYIGDSMTSGYGGVDPIYPEYAGEKLASYWSNELNRTVSFNTVRLIKGGMRTADLYAFLKGDVDYGDGYTADYFGSGESFDETSAKFRKEIASAQAISIMLGHSNISPYLTGRIAYDLGINEKAYPANETADRFFYGECYTTYRAIVEEYKAKLDELVESSTQAALVREILDYKFGKGEEKATLRIYLNDLYYSLAGEMFYFDKSMEAIKEVRDADDADIFVMGLYNPLENLKMTVDYQDNNESTTQTAIIPVGDIFGVVFDAFNSYMAYGSPYSDEYYFVEPAENVESLADFAAADEDYAKEIAEKEFGEYLAPIKETLPTQYEEIIVSLGGIIQKVCAHTCIDVNELSESLGDVADLIKELDLSNPFNIIGILADDNEAVRTLAYFYMLAGVQDGLLIHPSANGHAAMAEKLNAAIEAHEILPEAVKIQETADSIKEKLQEAKETAEEIKAKKEAAEEARKERQQAALEKLKGIGESIRDTMQYIDFDFVEIAESISSGRENVRQAFEDAVETEGTNVLKAVLEAKKEARRETGKVVYENLNKLVTNNPWKRDN